MLISAWFVHFVQPLHYSMQVKRVKAEQRSTIRSRIRDDDHLLQLSIAANKFEQLFDRDENEICLSGKMYDIASYRTDGDTVRCIVLKDEDESELHKQFSKNIDNKQQRTPKPIVFFWLYASHNAAVLPVAPIYRPLAPKTPETNDKPLCGYRRYVSQPPEMLNT